MRDELESKEPVDQLVIVYGTLKAGFGNHSHCLAPYIERGEAEFIEPIETAPEHTMISMGGFPGVIPFVGNTSIKGELYRLKSQGVINSLNMLEGHHGKDHPRNFYNVTEIMTNHGEALMYTLGEAYLDKKQVVESGEWVKGSSRYGY